MSVAQDGSTQRARVIAAMVGSRTVSDAAVAAGVSPRTVYRVLNRPGVREDIAKAREQAFEEGGALLRGLYGEAVETMARFARTCRDEELRLRAACRLAELALRHDAAVVVARQVAEQEKRLAALEAVARPRRVA